MGQLDVTGMVGWAEGLTIATAELAAAGVEQPAREARLLLGLAGGGGRGVVAGAPVDRAVLEGLVARRARREPMAFIEGSVGFWTLELAVSADTLIPRADSETLVEAVLAARPGQDGVRRVLDLGTGTGCLLLAVLSEYPRAWGVGVDRVAGACRLAAGNARANGLGGRAAFCCGSWGAALAGTFDVVLANPPYIETAAMAGLMEDVRDWEPASALDGGADGLDAYREVLSALPRLLAPGGLAVLELGAGQYDAVVGLAAGWIAEAREDLGGHQRALLLTREKSIGAGMTAL